MLVKKKTTQRGEGAITPAMVASRRMGGVASTDEGNGKTIRTFIHDHEHPYTS